MSQTTSTSPKCRATCWAPAYIRVAPKTLHTGLRKLWTTETSLSTAPFRTNQSFGVCGLLGIGDEASCLQKVGKNHQQSIRRTIWEERLRNTTSFAARDNFRIGYDALEQSYASTHLQRGSCQVRNWYEQLPNQPWLSFPQSAAEGQFNLISWQWRWLDSLLLPTWQRDVCCHWNPAVRETFHTPERKLKMEIVE